MDLIKKSKVILLFFICLIISISCQKKYERPDEFKIDLFENERIDSKLSEILSPEEALKIAKIVISVDSIKLLDQTNKNNTNQFFIYQIISGKVIKGDKDSIDFPINVLSIREIKLTNNKFNLYLDNLKRNKLLVKDFDIKYQLLERFPM